MFNLVSIISFKFRYSRILLFWDLLLSPTIIAVHTTYGNNKFIEFYFSRLYVDLI